jgi:hypothetical protein
VLSSACVRASASDIDIPEDFDAGDGGTISVTAQKPQQDQPHRPQATAGLLSRPASHLSMESKGQPHLPARHTTPICHALPAASLSGTSLHNRSAQADSASIVIAGSAGKGVVSQTTGKPLIGRSFPIPSKPYYRRTHAARRAMPCSASIISCTTVRRVCFPIPPFPARSRRISSVAGSSREPASAGQPGRETRGTAIPPATSMPWHQNGTGVSLPVPSVSLNFDVQTIG